MNTLRTAFFGVLLASFFVLAPATAQEADQARTIQLNGTGKVTVDPDQATIRFAIVTRDEDADEARRQNEAASREALDSVRELGIPENKIQMHSLRLQPQRERDPDTRQMREVGFEATRNVSVELDDIDLVPVVVAEVVQHGANRIEGVQYDREDRTEARNEALTAAAQNARAKAEVLAAALNASVGEALRIEERSYDFPRPMMRMEAAMGVEDAEYDPGAYAPGEIEVSAEVNVTFRLQD